MRMLRLASGEKVLPYVLILPASLFLAAFFFVPFVQVVVEAFTGEEGFTLAHFRTMADDWKFGPALANTLGLALVVVPVQITLVFTIPLGISDLAAGLIWFALLEQNGFLNSILYGLGLISGPQNLLDYRNTAALFAAVVVAEVWRATAIVLVILVAGMGLIPKEYDEAAEVFGAGPLKRFFLITLPLLRPSLQTALILRTILAFEVFAVVAVLAGNNLPVLMGETYSWQFDLRDHKVASAYAIVILAISLAFTVFFLWALRDRTREAAA
jgi:multiple sugar transport system permease protein